MLFFSEGSEYHVCSDLIPRVVPRACVLLLGVRVCRGDNIDAAHDQGTGSPGRIRFLSGWASSK